MKQLILPIFLIVLQPVCIHAQGDRFVCDESCDLGSDGAPFVPPTYEKVLGYLDYTDHAWDETIAVLPGAFRNTTTWHVAVNACMSGCKPEYMPILVAMTKGMAGGDFRRTLSSTHAWVPYSWLNGPVSRQLGISSSQWQAYWLPIIPPSNLWKMHSLTIPAVLHTSVPLPTTMPILVAVRMVGNS